MLKSLIHNPRRRGALGALVGALFPYAYAAYHNGIALGGDRDSILFICGVGAFFAIIGYGGFHGGFRRTKAFPEGNCPFIDFDELDKSFQSGSYAWMREGHGRR